MENIKKMANQVTDYTISTNNRKISGHYKVGPYKFDLFEMRGKAAICLIKELIKIEDSG